MLHLISGVFNIVFGILFIIHLRKIAKLEQKLRYTEASLERSDGNNRRMLEAIDEANRSTQERG